MHTLTKHVNSRPSQARVTRAEALVSAVRNMPIEDVRERIEASRNASSEEIIARQKADRRARAEAAASKIRNN